MLPSLCKPVQAISCLILVVGRHQTIGKLIAGGRISIQCNPSFSSFWTNPRPRKNKLKLQEAAASPTTPVYFTFDVDKGICTLTADCDNIDFFSRSCIYGDDQCEEDYFSAEY